MNLHRLIRLGALAAVAAPGLFAYFAFYKSQTPSAEAAAAHTETRMAVAPVSSASAAPKPRAQSLLDTADASCIIAQVAEVPIRIDDARQLRALVNPPPSGDAALGLALDVAVAHIMQLGYIAPSSAKRRLAVYRDVVQALRANEPSQSAAALEAVARQFAAAERAANVQPGPCYPTEPRMVRAATDLRPVTVPRAVQREWAVLRQKNARSPLFLVEHTFQPNSRAADATDPPSSSVAAKGVKRDLGLVALDGLELDLARALQDQQAGDMVGPITTATGVHLLRVKRRIERGALPEELQQAWLPSKERSLEHRSRPRSQPSSRAAELSRTQPELAGARSNTLEARALR
ncbi:MAG: hypothetical protein ACOY0T_33545 [Myxococcota bacterium]